MNLRMPPPVKLPRRWQGAKKEREVKIQQGGAARVAQSSPKKITLQHLKLLWFDNGRRVWIVVVEPIC